MKKIVISIILANLLSACASNKPAEPFAKAPVAPAAAAPAPTPAAETPVVGNAPAPDVDAQALAKAEADAKAKAEADAAAKAAALEAAEVAAKTDAAVVAKTPDPADALGKRNVHFPFDVDAIQDEDKPTVQAHGAFLGSHPERKVRMEGNADERGSSEYNLALGQRRAENTKKALVLSGAKAEQIEAISYGEERPIATGHDEASWAQNRRADIIYK